MKARVLMNGTLKTSAAKIGATEFPWQEQVEVPVFVLEQEGEYAVVIYKKEINVGTEKFPSIIPVGAVREVRSWTYYYPNGPLETYLTVDPTTRVA